MEKANAFYRLLKQRSLQIKDRTQVRFVNLHAFIPLEFRHIGKSPCVWTVGVKIPAQNIL